MVVRVSRRFGPFRASAYGGTYRYDEVEDVLDAVQPNWPKRIAIIAGAMTPAWAAFGMGWPLVAFVLAFGAAVGLVSTIQRTELAYGCSARQFGAWSGAVATGILFAVLAGMLVSAIVAPAQAQGMDAVPSFDPPTYCKNVSALFGGTEAAKANCLAGETSAREKVSRVWSQTPDAIKDRCTRIAAVAGTSSNYGALSGCLALGVGQEWLDGAVKLAR